MIKVNNNNLLQRDTLAFALGLEAESEGLRPTSEFA
jgi:hypothetical protein